MKGRRIRSSASSMLVVAAALCACRASLPEAVPPWTPTPDAAFRRAPPAPGAASKGRRWPKAEAFELANGLDLLVVERHDLPIVSVVYANGASALAETTEQAGLAALTASLLNEGTRMNDGSVLRQLRAGGVTLSVESSQERTTLATSCLATDFERALELVARVVRYPAFDGERFTAMRFAQMEKLFADSTNVVFHLEYAVLEELYGPGHPLGRSALGRSKTLESLTPVAVRDYYQKRYQPQDSVVVVVGAISARSVRTAFEKQFGDWAPAENAAPANAPAVRPPAGPHKVHAVSGGDTHSYFVMGFATVGAEDPDYVPLRIATTLLGGLASSRANVELRSHQGASYGIHANYRDRRGSGELLIYGDLRAEDLGPALVAVRGDVERLARTPLPAAELEAAKQGLFAELSASIFANASIARTLAALHGMGLSPDFYADLEQRIRATTAAQVQAAAARHLTRARSALAVLAYPHYARGELRAFGPVEWFRLEGGD